MRVVRLIVIFAVVLGGIFISAPLLAVTKDGDINVSGTVPTPPPKSAPTIDQPTPGTTFDTKHITVSGRCTADLIVKIYSNDVFVGSTICQQNGTYSLKIDLFEEQNDLVARQFDSLNQPSPDSSIVTVYYVPPEQQPQLPDSTPSTPPPAVAHFQLIINYDYTVQGIFVDQPFRLPIQFRGGAGPYEITVDWGDGSSNRFQRDTTDPFDTSYTYTQPGRYIVTIRVTDSTGQTAYLQFVTIVHGEVDSPGTILLFGREINQDITLIVVFVGALLLAIAFLAGRGLKQPDSIDK